MSYAWIDLGDGRSVYRRVIEPVSRRGIPTPHVIRDEMDPVQSQASGKIYTSKSAIRAEYKRLGMIEVGNDPARLRPRETPPTDKQGIRDAIERAKARLNT